MGLLEEMFAKKKESTRNRTPKATSVKKDPEITPKPIDKNRTSSPSSFFGTLKRVQGAVTTSTSKTPTPKRYDVKSKTASGLKSKPPEKEKDKEKRPWYRSPSKSILKKEPIKSSTASLNVGSNVQKSAVDPKRRPASLFTTNVTIRRGQNPKLDGQNLGDNLSRTSSITNLDAEQRSSKGAKPRKSASRDRIDKIGDKKHDKKGLNKNNNKLDAVENTTYPSVDSLPEEELLHLRRQLQEMAQEKTNLALQLGEQKGQLNNLQKEIQKLKSFQDESNLQMDQLTEENSRLRKRLKDVAHSPLSDNEKQQLLFNTHRHHHSSSAPASIATNIVEDGSGPDTTCTTPDWDKHSSSNVSEVSVACLQDKINQMQETHYSTNEELQATLQELTDLQRQLTELQQENERLNDEKNLMFDSLCRQTERLNDSRSEVESLKQLLYQEKDDTGQYESALEREQKLVDLLKSAQDEREGMLVKIEQLTVEGQEARTGNASKEEQIGQLRERVRTLECTLDAKHAEHKLLDQELAQAKDQCSAKQIEINRLTDLLDNARTKITELEQDRALSDKSELDELLDNARKEKDALESEVAHLKEQLAISKNEIEKLKEQVSILQEECKVTRNNAKTTQSDLEYKCEKLQKDKNALNEQIQEFQEALNELQVQSQCQLEDKRQLSSVLSETQRNLSEAERKNQSLENELDELKKHVEVETADWEKFQEDLLTSVRVANDFKTEAQLELQRMILENKAFRDREKQLRAEIEKLKGETVKRGQTKTLSSREDAKMDVLMKRPNKNEPKKRDTYQKTESSGSKSNKSLSEPALSRPVKKREIKPSKQKRLKTLSVEEETLLKSLDTYNKRIDKNIPDENLTEEQRVIRKLKVIYEDELLKVKPVAPKAKDQLAISKPLLDSVLTNPKLLEIVGNPNVRTIEDMATFAKETPEIRTLIQGIDRSARGKSEDFGRPVLAKRISIIGRSMSYDDMYELQDDDPNPSLYRTVEADDLTRDILLSKPPRESSIVPSDSASNKRYSDFAVVVNKDKERKPTGDLNCSTLDRIVKSIPKGTPETQLSKEQKFALKLSQALEKRKNTLKKLSKAKTLTISEPTYDSVINNPKLEEILLDPDIVEVSRRKSDILAPSNAVEVLRTTKSYDNINFAFSTSGAPVEEYSAELISPLDSSSDVSGAEFNLDTGLTGPYDPMVSEGCHQVQFISSLGVETARKEPSISGEKPFNAKEKFSTFLDSKAAQRELTMLDGNIPHSNQENKRDSVTSRTSKSRERMKIIKSEEEHDSLTYNDTLNKQKERTENPNREHFVKVDLLQEKIRKIVNNDKKSTSAADNKIKDISTTKPETNADRPIEASKPKENDSLVYNETLNRKLKPKADSEAYKLPGMDDTQSISNDRFSRNVDKNEDQRPEVTGKHDSRNVRQYDEKMKNISEKLEVIHRLITEDTNENTQTPVEIVTSIKVPSNLKLQYKEFDDDAKDAPKLFSDQMPFTRSDGQYVAKTHFRDVSVEEDDTDSSETTDGKIEKTTQEYDYHAILRENRFGVKPPLNYRLSYKDVVHEIKNRFSTDDHDIDLSEKDEPENDDTSGNFFTLRRTYGVESLDKEGHSENVAEIDKEMDDIFHKYLNTRVSKIIKESEVKPLEKVKKFPDISPPVPRVEKFGDKLKSVAVIPTEERDSSKETPIPKPRKLNTQVSVDHLVVDVPDNPIENHEAINTDMRIHEVTSTSVEGLEGKRNASENETISEGNFSYELPRNIQLDQNKSNDIEDIEHVNEEKCISHQKEEFNLTTTYENHRPHAAQEDYSEVKYPHELPTNSHFGQNKTNDIKEIEDVCIEKTTPLQKEDFELGDTVSADPLEGDTRHNSTENHEAPDTNVKFPEFTKSSIESRQTLKNSNEIESILQEKHSCELPSNSQLHQNKLNYMENTEHVSEEKTVSHKAEESKDHQVNHRPHLAHEDYSKTTVVPFKKEFTVFETVGNPKCNSPTLITYPVESSLLEEDENDQTTVHKLQQDDSNNLPKKQQTSKTDSVVDEVGSSVVKLSEFGQPKIVVSAMKMTKSEEDPSENWEPNDHDGEPLTEEEVRLIQRAKKKRLSRPLSDFSADDLEFIKRISTSYSLEDEDEPPKISISSSLENEQPQTHQGVSGQLYLLEEDGELQKDNSDSGRDDYKIEPPLSFHDPPSSSIQQVSEDSSHESHVDSFNNHISSHDTQERDQAGHNHLDTIPCILRETYDRPPPSVVRNSKGSASAELYELSGAVSDFGQEESELKPPLPFSDPPNLSAAKVLEDISYEHHVEPFDHHHEYIQKYDQSVPDRTKELDLLPKASERRSPDKTNEKRSSFFNKSEKSDDLDALLLKMTSQPRNRSRLKNVQRTDLSPVKIEYTETSNKQAENVRTVNIGPHEIPVLGSESTSSDTVVLRSTPRMNLSRTAAVHRRSSSGLVASASETNSETNVTTVRMRRERPLSAPKVKSFAQHFERLSLEKSKQRQSVHTTNIVRSRHIDRTSFSTLAQNSKKRTSSVPRHENQDSTPPVKSCDTSHNIHNDNKDLEVRKMLGNEKNFSDSQHNVPQGVSVVELCQKEVTEVPGLHETRTLATEGPQEAVEGTKKDSGETVTIKKSVTLTETLTETMITPNKEIIKDEVDDQGNVASGTSATYSTIEVAGKSEQLDITKASESGIEDDCVENVSDVNLFSMEAPSFDDSYLSLFKSPEIKAMEQFSGKKPRKGLINITYLGEVSDSESYDDIDNLEKSFLHGTGSKPKIIDFVPLDEATKPVFEKEELPNYNTLEREKTFQVLSSAASTAKEKDVNRNPDSAAAKLKQSGSRSSFSAAKKLFEDLQAKSENKTDKQVTRKASTNEKLGNVESAKSSHSGPVKKTIGELDK